MNNTSLSLLQRICHGGDPSAWARFVDVYTPLLNSWLTSQHIDQSDISEIVQELLSVVRQELPQLEDNGSAGAFRSWLRHLLARSVRHYCQVRGNPADLEDGNSLLSGLQQLEHDDSDLSRRWNQEHDQQVVARLLEQVRQSFQPEILEAFDRQLNDRRLPHQIAEELQLPLATVYMARNQLLNTLRREAAGLVDSA